MRGHDKTKKNPLKNKAQMLRLNPYAKEAAKTLKAQEDKRKVARQALLKAKKTKADRAAKHKRTERYQKLQTGLKESYKAAEDKIEQEDKEGNYVPGDTDEEDE